MLGQKPIEITKDNKSRFQAFVVFEASAPRISPGDIYLTGDKVREFFDRLHGEIMTDDSLKGIMLQNRLHKIDQMMDLLTSNDQMLLTKFYDKIWRRYGYVSNLGETLIDLKTLTTLFPEYDDNNYKGLIASRLDKNTGPIDVEASDDDSADKDSSKDEKSSDEKDTKEGKTVTEKTS